MQSTNQPQQKMRTKNMTTLSLRKSIGHSPWRLGCLSILLAFVYFAFSQTAQALLPAPTPDGAYLNWNTAEGSGALFNLTSGTFNTAIGGHALYGDTIGQANTAVGAFALATNSSGDQNVAVGQGALVSNTHGSYNTASGFQALKSNTTGTSNTAIGNSALFGNTIGDGNTATGDAALFTNTTGSSNTAYGVVALTSNTTGSGNIAVGNSSLSFNSAGDFNTAIGIFTLGGNDTGDANSAVGFDALTSNTSGNFNTAFGNSALSNNFTGNDNTALGNAAGSNLTTGDNNIDIGNIGVTGESGKIRIGTVGTQNATFVAGVHGVAVTGSAVLVSSTGQLGVAASSERFKNEIKAMDKASEAILALKPVIFRYKKEIDPEGIPQFGLVAEEVEKVNPDLVVRDKEGKPYSVRYDQVNAMLLNEFLKAHRIMQEQGATIARLEKQIETLTAGLQKVSAQLELSKAAPQTVLNRQ
jgi:hypothetical protein